MDAFDTGTLSSMLRRPPQITLVLDRETRVLSINRDLAGTGFGKVLDDCEAAVHDVLHPGCKGKCRFNKLLTKAWKGLDKDRTSVEWEISNDVLGGNLRLNLSKPPTAANVPVERRRRFAILTITDITEIRRRYETLLAATEELRRKLEEQSYAAANDRIDSPDTLPAASDEEMLRGLHARVIAAQEDERRRIAADLHDGVAQSLGIIKYAVEAKQAKLRQQYPHLDLEEFDPIIDRIRDAVDEVRKISRNLNPSAVNNFGICTAIDMLCTEFGAEVPEMEIKFSACINEVELPDATKIAIYRVVQEALNNIHKHARATRVSVDVDTTDQNVLLEIRDDGTGFDVHEMMCKSCHSPGFGLSSMHHRVKETGGQFRIESAPGAGTSIHAFWPRSALQLLGDQAVLNSV